MTRSGEVADSLEFSFVAMEYYGLILNRTFRVSLAAEGLQGTLVRGITTVRGGVDPLTEWVTSSLAVSGDLQNPNSYVSRELAASSREHRSNFLMKYADISSVTYDSRRKWGMGYYPHDGRVYVRTRTSKREFIILGSQSGGQIRDRIESAIRDRGVVA